MRRCIIPQILANGSANIPLKLNRAETVALPAAPNGFGATVTTKTDLVALFEPVQAILTHADEPS
jgi:hypothetical protein